MKAAIKSVYSDDIDDLSGYSPDPSKPFEFSVVLMIGPAHDETADLFRINVQNSLYVAKICGSGQYFLGYSNLVMDEFNFHDFKVFLDEYVAKVDYETWDEIAQYLKRLMSWKWDGVKLPLLPN